MVTLKLNFETDTNLHPFLKECNKIKRIAFNLFKDTNDKAVVTRKIKSSYNINYDIVDATIMESQVNDAYALMQSCKERKQSKLIFGSKHQWKRFINGLISKNEFNSIKNTNPILFTGRSKESFGNRKIKLDIENKQIIFKRTRHDHINLKIQTSNSRWKLLSKLQDYFDYSSTPVTYKLSDTHIYVSFDESILTEKKHEFKENRIAALDLNPNYIGFVVKDFNDNDNVIIHKSIFDLSKLNDTHDKDKKDYEIIQIAKRISILCKHYQVECVGFEKLTMMSKDHGKGKKLNRLINNSWNRNCFVDNLRKRLNILGIQNQEIICAYSSTVGCLDYPDETDCIAAAIEMSRRCYVYINKYNKKKKEFLGMDILLPKLERELIKERWNSILSDYNPTNLGYKGIHEYLKKQKKLLELRFLFKDYNFNSWSFFRNKSIKSLTDCYTI